MLIRISLIVAIIAALAAGALNIFQVRDKINTIISQREGYHSERDQARTELSATKTKLARTEDTLKQTEQDLADTKSDRDKAVAEAAKQKQLAADVSDKLAKVTAEKDDAENQLAAYKATGLSSEQVGKLSQTLKESRDAIDALTEEKVVLNHSIDRLKTRLAKYEDPDRVVTMRSDLKGKVVVVDPKWDFVVLNIGEDQGTRIDGELLVSRDGRLVSKVIIRSMERNRCIANIVPGWKLGDVMEGDSVIPAYPAS